jgi:TRAP-type mannitol/chloroaromatic compound transport system permease large subunit
MISDAEKINRNRRRAKRRSGRRTVYDIIIPVSGWLALILLLAAVLVSWAKAGDSGGGVGAMGEISLVLAAGAFLMGRMIRQENKTLRRPVNLAVILSAAVAAADIVLFIAGIV